MYFRHMRAEVVKQWFEVDLNWRLMPKEKMAMLVTLSHDCVSDVLAPISAQRAWARMDWRMAKRTATVAAGQGGAAQKWGASVAVWQQDKYHWRGQQGGVARVDAMAFTTLWPGQVARTEGSFWTGERQRAILIAFIENFLQWLSICINT